MTTYQRAFLAILHDQLQGMAGSICRGLRMILDEGMASPRSAKFADLCYWIAGGLQDGADKAECSHTASLMMQALTEPTDTQRAEAVTVRCSLIDLARAIRRDEAQAEDAVTTDATRASVVETLNEDAIDRLVADVTGGMEAVPE